MFLQVKTNSTLYNNKLLQCRLLHQNEVFHSLFVQYNIILFSISRKCFLVEWPHMFSLFNNDWTIYQNLTTMPAAEPWLVSCVTIVRQTADCYGNPINAQFIIVCPYSHVGVLLSLELNSSFVWNVRILKRSSSNLKFIVMKFPFVVRVWQWLNLLPVKDHFFHWRA